MNGEKREKLRFLLLSTYVALSVFSIVSSARDCDTSLQPGEGSMGYQLRADGARCEGFYVAEVSTPTLELLGGTLDKPRFELKQTTLLQISIPEVLRASIDGPVQVRASALPFATYYRLDATISKNDTMQWPAADVLHPAGIGDDKLGVLAWVETDGDRLFVPVSVISDESAMSPANQAVNLAVRTSHDVEYLLWRVLPVQVDNNSMTVPGWQDATPNPLYAGRTVILEVPMAAQGPHQVDFAGKLQGEDRWSTLSFTLLMPPSMTVDGRHE